MCENTVVASEQQRRSKTIGKKRTLWYSLTLAVTLLLTVLNVFLLRTFDVAGVPSIFALLLLYQLLLVTLLIFSLFVLLRTPARIVWSIVLSALRGIHENEYVQRASRRVPFLVPWIQRRFTTDRPTGLALTLGVIAVAVFGVLFANVARAVASDAVYVGFDLRVVNLMPNIRTAGESSFFAFFTFAASYLGIIFFLCVLSAVAVWRRQWSLPVLFIAAYGVEALCSEISKNAIRRPRPDETLRQLSVSGFSFPSGHTLAATVIVGLLAYLVFRFTKSHLLKVLVVLLAVTMIALVAMSRVYFAVHYPTDVLGGILLGTLILTIFITVIEMNQRYRLVGWVQLDASAIASLCLAFVSMLAFTAIFSGFTHFESPQAHATPQHLSALNSSTIQRLPHYSETLTGARMEPINFIFVGDQTQIEDAFAAGGWYKADPPTLANTLRELVTAANNRQYLTAPVTPSYLDAKPQTLAFEKPTATNTLQQRHHTRIWRLNVELNGQPVWVATASLDLGIGIGSAIPLPTHHIDPNIDREREYIVQSLHAPTAPLVSVVGPQLGKNASGDSFFTDGKAALIQFH
jgi:membrane-associated phospholipid phosphatase